MRFILRKNSSNGFTIVELLIVIVVIGILAALVLNTVTGAQMRARNTTRVNDAESIMNALAQYYEIHEHYPPSTGGCGATAPNTSWCNSVESIDSEGRWIAPHSNPNDLDQFLQTQPQNVGQGTAPLWGNTDGQGAYFYHAHNQSGHPHGPQSYMLIYSLEGAHELEAGPDGVTGCGGITRDYGGVVTTGVSCRN